MVTKRLNMITEQLRTIKINHFTIFVILGLKLSRHFLLLLTENVCDWKPLLGLIRFAALVETHLEKSLPRIETKLKSPAGFFGRVLNKTEEGPYLVLSVILTSLSPFLIHSLTRIYTPTLCISPSLSNAPSFPAHVRPFSPFPSPNTFSLSSLFR